MIRIGEGRLESMFTFDQAVDEFKKIFFPDIEVDVIEAVLRSHNGDEDRAMIQLAEMSMGIEPGGGQGEVYYWSSTLGWRTSCCLYCINNEPGGGQGEMEESKTEKREKTNPDDLFFPNFLTPAPPSGGGPTPSPGDAFKFLSASQLYQCHALLPRAQPCEKIFANIEDFEAHCMSVHHISGRAGQNFWQVLHIDSLNNLYIL